MNKKTKAGIGALAVVAAGAASMYIAVPGLTTISQFAQLMDEPAYGTDMGGWVREDSTARMIYESKTVPLRLFSYIVTRDGVTDTLVIPGDQQLSFARGQETVITPLDPEWGKWGGSVLMLDGSGDCRVNTQTFGYTALYRLKMREQDNELVDWYYLDAPDTTGMMVRTGETYVLQFSAKNDTLGVWRRWSNEVTLLPMGEAPPDTTQPEEPDGPTLADVYWVNDYTLRVVFDGGLDPSTFQASDIEVEGPEGPLEMNPPSYHWDAYFNLTCFGCGIPGEWSASIPAGAVADTSGVPNTDLSVEWVVE